MNFPSLRFFRRLSFSWVFGTVVLFLLNACQSPDASKSDNGTKDPSLRKSSGPSEPAPSNIPKSLNAGSNSDFHAETHPPVEDEDVPLLAQMNAEYSRLAEAALPSVVSLTCYKTSETKDPIFTFGFPFKQTAPPAPSLPVYGAGVLVSRDGYIVTNQHVVADADRIEVQLSDKRQFVAQFIASDEQADLAVLKLDGKDFIALPWGDSDEVHVGEQVFAIGNPFNLNDTFSSGIISAKSREFSSLHTVDFIQTNAMLNPGSSGGALINIHGEIVGINAAIVSPSRFNVGVGFAIPSNLAKFTVNSLIKNGKVVRGFLGVTYQPEPISEEIRAQLGLSEDQGALVDDVWPGSPADAAQLKHGDYIEAIDGRKITSSAELRLVMAQMPIGQQIKIAYLRDERMHEVTVTIVEYTDALRQAAQPPVSSEATGPGSPGAVSSSAPTLPSPPGSATPGEVKQSDVKPGDIKPIAAKADDSKSSPPKLVLVPDLKPAKFTPGLNTVLQGIQVTSLTPALQQHHGPLASHGVVVANIVEGALAQATPLTVGDIIKTIKVGRRPWVEINSTQDYLTLLQKLKPTQSVLLVLAGRGQGGGGMISLTPAAP